jgi:hypothetical protein
MPIILNGTTGITTPGITNTGTFTFQGAVELPAGTVSAPSLTTTGDTNTGIFFPAADTIAFVEGGVESLRLNSSGKLVYAANALGAASAGLLENDGTSLYFTPTSTQRGVVPGMQYYVLNAPLAGANVNTAQNVLGVSVTLSSNTRYAFEAVYALSKTAGTTSHTTGIGFGGTATINNIGYWAQAGSINSAGFTDLSNSGSFQYYVQTASNTVLNGAQAQAATFRMYKLSGTVSINAGGTFTPQYTLSAAPGGAYTTAAGCWFRIYPIGAAGSNVSVGTWT